MKNIAMNKILVVIVTYNAMKWIERCLGSLRSSMLVPDVFVVDNGSTDGTQDFIKKESLNIIFNQSEKNLGFGKANNLGLQYALDHNYDFVYLLNQDAWIFPETLGNLVELSIKNPDYGILSPFQMNSDLYHIDSGFAVDACSWDSNPEIFSDFFNGKMSEVYPVKTVMAAHWFITRNTILKIGGFSPSFPHYGEDYNYCDRVLYHGLKIGVIPSLRVVHDRGSRKDSLNTRLKIDYTSSIRNLSSPFIKDPFFYITDLLRSLVNMVKYMSFQPMVNYSSLLCNYFRIKHNKKKSLCENCAFLRL